MKPTHATGRPRARPDPGVSTPGREDMELQPIDAPIGSSPALGPIEIPTRCSTESMPTDASLDQGPSTCNAEITAPGHCREAIMMEPTVAERPKSAQPDQAAPTCVEETVIARQDISSTAATLGSESAHASVHSRVRFSTSASQRDPAESAMEIPLTRFPVEPSVLDPDEETARFGQ
jgi:hypothetical protein